MQRSISLPSILLPRRRVELMSRPRLLEVLHGLLEYKLNLVTGPAGYGKTSLLIDFAHAANMPVCWYTVDRRDQELKTFLEHLFASVSTAFPNYVAVSRSLLDVQTDLDIDSVVTVITNELYQLTHEHFIIILDDFHHVAENSPIIEFVSKFVERVYENCHLFIASRRKLSLPGLPVLMGHSLVSGINLEDLAFTSREIQDLALRNYQMVIGDEAASKLVAKTEGWITGLLLSSPVLHPDMINQNRALRATGMNLADYWAHYLAEQPTKLQDFLLYTSILDEFDTRLCEQVLEKTIYPQGTNWQALVQEIIQSNLFIQVIDPGGPWLRYHSLFKDYLVSCLEQNHPGARAIILKRLLDVYIEQGNWERAYDACMSLDNPEMTLNLIQKAGPDMIANGRFGILERWLDPIPETTLINRPCLMSLKGIVAVMAGKTAQAIGFLTQAEVLLRAAKETRRLARTLIRRSAAYHFQGGFQEALKDAQEALDLVDEIGEEDNELISIRANALKARAASLHHLGGSIQAVQDAERALELYNLVSDFPNMATLHLELGPVYRSIGNIEAAQRAYKNAEAYWRKEGNLYRLADLLNNLGVFFHHTGDFEKSALALDEAIRNARQVGFRKLEAYGLASLGDLYADLGARQAAQQAYEQAYEVARRIQNRYLCFYLDLARVSLARKDGDFDRANHLLEQAWPKADEISLQQHWGCHLEAALLAQVQQKYPETITQLNKAVKHYTQAHLLAEEIPARLYLANACYAVGNQDLAFEHLRSALDLAQDKSLCYSLAVAGQNTRNFLKIASSSPGADLRAERLLNLIEQYEATLPALRRKIRRQKLVIPLSPPQLVIQALGEARVVLNNQLVTSKDWQSPVQREMFFFLLSHPEGVSRRALEAAFWPDSSQARDQCNRVIYKIRAILGKDTLLFENDRYLFDRSLDYEYDVEAFTEFYAQAKSEENIQRRTEIFRQMLFIYKGHYLMDADGSWAISERERLWHICVDAFLNLAEHHLDLREYPAALDYCWRALEKEPLLEAAHRIAMRTYIAMGDRARAARQYQLCHNSVVERLGIKPSKETEALYRTLMR
ncbi:MAG: tetratricopeptide repeat protein [Chloroflexota bacterium]